MLTISELGKSFGGRTLFNEVSLQVNRGDRIGLVGPNGAGKSTLFAMILKAEEPDAGSVNFERNVTVGFLPQESAPAGDETVLELATAISPEFAAIRKRVLDEDEHPAEHTQEESVNDHAHFNEAGGYQIESKAKRLLAGLGFREKDFNRPARQMSGGWVMRAHLARLLVQEPDLLMLDEPTNHLDLSVLLWVQEYLQGYPGAILMISHDREFLNQLVGSIVEIRNSKLISYRGNYEDYLAQRAAAEAQHLAAYKNQQREIARLMDFVARFGAKNTKAAQAQSKLKQVERMEKIEAPEAESRGIGFQFPQPQRSGQKVITLKNIHQAYGETPVYQGMDFLAERGQRIVLVGPNGAGKSTLLKILAGVVPFQQGERDLGHNVKFGYYAQYRVEMLQASRTVLDEALDTPQRVTEQFVRTVLGSFLFRGDDVFKRVSVLSGGEKSRLALVKLLLDPPNLLLMDEPTTHLDMASIDALVEALKQYEGTIIFISHDVYFIRAIANHVVHVNAGRLTHYSGNYQYYLDKSAATSERAALFAPGTHVTQGAPAKPKAEERPGEDRKERKRREAEERQARSGERKKRQQAVETLEKEIARLEARQTELTAELELPETYADGPRVARVNQELKMVMDQLPELTTKWEAASQKLSEWEVANARADAGG